MNDYELYEIDDFLKDDFFIEWVMTPEKRHEEFWAEWLSTHPYRADRVERAKQILQSLKIVPADARLSADDLSAMLTRIDEGITPNNKFAVERKRLFMPGRLWLGVAALLVVLFGLGLFFYMLKQPGSNVKMAENTFSVVAVSDTVKIYNNSDAKKVAKLDDGSVIILTPHSGLLYTSGFNKKTREITFNGEAFFEIKHNNEKPFLIYSHGIVTKVLGTSFNIRSFAGEDEYHIVVNTGKVQVKEVTASNRSGSTKAIVLLPNQQATYLHKAFKFKEFTVDRPLPLSENEAVKSFAFSNTPFNDVMSKLEEAYHIKIQYDKQKFSTYTITATLSKLPLDEKIKMICSAVNAECSYQDGDIIIY
jgi:transmembrane sensor